MSFFLFRDYRILIIFLIITYKNYIELILLLRLINLLINNIQKYNIISIPNDQSKFNLYINYIYNIIGDLSFHTYHIKVAI